MCAECSKNQLYSVRRETRARACDRCVDWANKKAREEELRGKAQIDYLTREIDSAEQQIATLRTELTSAHAQIQLLTTSLANEEKSALIETLNAKISRKKAKIRNLKHDLEQFTQNSGEIQGKNEELTKIPTFELSQTSNFSLIPTNFPEIHSKYAISTEINSFSSLKTIEKLPFCDTNLPKSVTNSENLHKNSELEVANQFLESKRRKIEELERELQKIRGQMKEKEEWSCFCCHFS